MFKAVVLVCVIALSIQSITSQCIGAGLAAPFAPWGAPCGPWEAMAPIPGPCSYGPAMLASSGGGFGVSSASPIPVSGVSILSENAIEGLLAVTGTLPFLGTVALEGALPTAGAGAVNYGCGNGEVAMIAEDIAPGLAGPFGYDGYGYGPLGMGPYGRPGCGCGAFI